MPAADLPAIGIAVSSADVNVQMSECRLSIGSKSFERTIGSSTEDVLSNMDQARLRVLHEALFSVIHSISAEAPIFSATIDFEDVGVNLYSEAVNCICMASTMADILNLANVPIPAYSFITVVETLAR
ncbi:hypothetical protein BH11CYA1_BH11CYA1_43960 [soil metagenome]